MIERKTHGIDLEKQIMTLMMPKIYLQLGGWERVHIFTKLLSGKGSELCLGRGRVPGPIQVPTDLDIECPHAHLPGKIKPK